MATIFGLRLFVLKKLGKNEVLKFVVFSLDGEIANKEIIKDIIKILNN